MKPTPSELSYFMLFMVGMSYAIHTGFMLIFGPEWALLIMLVGVCVLALAEMFVRADRRRS